MDLAALVPIIVVLCLGAISPGPSLAVLLRNTMEGGKTRGVACGVGHGIGFGIYAFIAVSGIAQLKARAGGAAEILEIVGGLFLLLLAALMLRGSSDEVEPWESPFLDTLSSISIVPTLVDACSYDIWWLRFFKVFLRLKKPTQQKKPGFLAKKPVF